MSKPTYVTGESIPNGTIVHQITELEYQNGKAYVKKSYAIVKGSIKRRNETKKAKEAKKVEQAKQLVQEGLDKFQKVEIQEDGF